MGILKHLFAPITIGKMRVKNRLVMSPMGINFGVDDDGYVTDQLIYYFVERAKGGTGMLLVGGAAVHPSGLDLPRLPRIWDDKYISGFRRMTEAVHEYDVRFGIQLLHGGRQASLNEKVAPSPLPAQGVVKGIPKELTIDEIEEIIDAYGDAARRGEEAGFDFVEIHGAHGYLITQFLALNSNKRKDEYGGSFENRIRFLLRILRNIKEKTSENFPIGIRINGDDYIKDGWTIKDTIKIAPILEKEGADYLHISAGIYGSYPPGISVPSMYAKQGVFIPLAEKVKKIVTVPVIGVGRITDLEYANRIIKEGKVDMVAIGRGHLADPEIARKALSGKLIDIRPCIGCCLGCIGRVLKQEEATCVMNPRLGREYLIKEEVEKTLTPKKILVIGAGPSGLALSRVAAMRGHKVLICEEKGYVGGMLRVASFVPGRGDLNKLINYYQHELEKLGVEIRLNTPVDNGLIESENPDIVVIATGSQPKIPIISGLFKTKMNVHTATDVLEEKVIVGDQVIVLGGNMIGLQVADFLREKGKNVCVLHQGKHFAEEMAANDRVYLRERLKNNQVKLFKNVSIRRFLPKGIIFSVKNDNKEVKLDGYEDIIISMGMESIRSIANIFKEKDIPVYIIGDANKPGTLLDSQMEAYELGRSI